MKRFLHLTLSFIIVVISFSCNNSSGTTKEESKPADTPVVATTATGTVNALFKVMLIKHKVLDYTKWRPTYDAHDSVRKAYGQTDLDLLTADSDPNNVFIVEKISDVQKARDFTSLPSLKEVMAKAGVVSAPSFYFFDVIRSDESAIDTKERVMVTHHVKDFDAWVKVYDAEGKATRASEGMVDRVLARAIDDPNFVMLVFAVTDMAKAKASITSESKKKLMMSAGVEGAPAIEFYKQVK
jgi:quinol monooxygenase YgiN